jgi:hypothetical protein
VETDGRKTLECGGPVELDGHAGSPSMLKAFVRMVLLSENDWFYASPTLSPAPPDRTFAASKTALKEQKKAIQRAGFYKVAPTHGKYACLDLDFRLCDFQLSSAREPTLGCVVCTNLLRDALNKAPLLAMCKAVDAVRDSTARNALEGESCVYAALEKLQGEVIPRVYGYYNVWGILHLLALEPVGDAQRML